VVKHYFHGAKVNRRYNDRWKILVEHGYNPLTHVRRRPDGLLVPTKACPPQLLRDILTYFAQRNEDEYTEAPNSKSLEHRFAPQIRLSS
jgi:hypothetical protein